MDEAYNGLITYCILENSDLGTVDIWVSPNSDKVQWVVFLYLTDIQKCWDSVQSFLQYSKSFLLLITSRNTVSIKDLIEFSCTKLNISGWWESSADTDFASIYIFFPILSVCINPAHMSIRQL